MEEERKTVKEVVGTCIECQQTKTDTSKTKEETIKITSSEPFEKVYIDICGPWRETIRKEKYIMAMIDHFSKYIILTAIKRQDEQTIMQTILTKWILKFGAPKEIHVDCGKSFESQKVQELMIKQGIQLVFSSPYHHNTNGMVERQFRTIREYIQASLKERKETSWADTFPEVEFTLNATRQKTIGRSPAEVILNRKIDRLKWYSNKMNTSAENIKYPDGKTRRNFNIGDQVLVKKRDKK
jgi:transposase InsO family protein